MTRVILCDDHAVVRRGLREILEESEGIEVRAEASSGSEVLGLLRRQECDLLILDLTMPGMSGLEVLKEVKKEWPKLPVLVLSFHAEEQYALRALKAGAAGYLTKDSAPEQLLQALSKILAGGKYVTPALAEHLVGNLQTSEKVPHESLSDREYQIFCLIASGKTPTRIASDLGLSVKTVSTYRARILEKMHLHNNAELTHYAMGHRLVECLSD